MRTRKSAFVGVALAGVQAIQCLGELTGDVAALVAAVIGATPSLETFCALILSAVCKALIGGAAIDRLLVKLRGAARRSASKGGACAQSGAD